MKAILLLSLLAVSYAALSEQEYQAQFTSFMTRFEKKYESTSELFKRYAIFKAKVDEINAHNSNNAFTFELGVNEHSDLTWEEFSAIYLGFEPSMPDYSPVWVAPNDTRPMDIDWRTKGGVTDIKNQGSCGSCWAFAGTGTLETWSFQKTGTLVDLADQMILDCSGTGSCNGGMPEAGIQYGCKTALCATKDYKYTARKGTCNPQKCTGVSSTCGGAKKLASEDAIGTALTQNTISLGVYIGAAFQSYKSGVFNGPCGSGGHAMVLVANDAQTWSIKNSWGKSWGEQGYSRWARGKNLCQFSGHAHIPN
jgi:C1A family cysteine protease